MHVLAPCARGVGALLAACLVERRASAARLPVFRGSTVLLPGVPVNRNTCSESFAAASRASPRPQAAAAPARSFRCLYKSHPSQAAIVPYAAA